MSAPDPRRDFFLVFSVLLLAVVLAGFGPTFFLRSAFHGPALPWWLVLHGVVQTAWFVLLPVQTALVRQRRLGWHRSLGWAAAAIALLVVATSPMVIARSVPRGLARGHTDIEMGFLLVVNLLRLPLFAVLVGGAIALRRVPDWHKRALLVASMSNVTPAASRLGHQLGVGPLVSATLSIVLFGGALVLFDRRRLGRVHPVTRWGVMSLVLVLAVPIFAVASGLSRPLLELLRNG